MLSKEKKKELIKELTNTVEQNDNIIFADFSGLKTPEMDELKDSLRAKGGSLRVIKKSLLTFASRKTGIDFNLGEHKGSIAFIYGEPEGVQTAKALAAFSKAHENLTILGGLFERVFVNREKIQELASLSSREELYAKLMYLFNPAGSLVRVLASPVSGLVNIISNIKDKK